MKMKSILGLALVCLFVCSPAGAQNKKEFANVTYVAPATLTIKTGVPVVFQSGSTVDFAAGSTVDFTGATVTGLPSGGGSGSVTAFAFTNSTGITGTVTNSTSTPTLSLALTKAGVGLSLVDNTADASKPVSTAQQTALNLKADDSAVVHQTGTETIANKKTFSTAPEISTATASTPTFFSASKTLVSGVAGTDYIAVTGTPAVGLCPRATGATTATWQPCGGGTAVAFASAPTPVEGMTQAFTDSTTVTWGATITGGGANKVLGYYNGTNWTVSGK